MHSLRIGIGSIKLGSVVQFKSAGLISVINNLKNFPVMSTSTSSYKVEHDSRNKQFYIPLDNSDSTKSTSVVRAILEYDIYKLGEGQAASNVMDMYHTEVPPQLQGKGIAQILAKAAMDHAVANDYKMKLTCSYLQNYIKKNPVDVYVNRLVEDN